MDKPVTKKQWLEVLLLVREIEGLTGSVIGRALADGTLKTLLSDLVPSEVVYPEWIVRRETPELACKKVVNPGEVKLWLDQRQERANPYPTGNEVYAEIKKQKLLESALSLGHLQWYAQNPDEIPKDFKGKLIYAWADVVRDAGGYLRVPCLRCDVPQPCVDWSWLGFRWNGHEPAGLRRET